MKLAQSSKEIDGCARSMREENSQVVCGLRCPLLKMFHGRFQQLIAGNFVVIRCNWESRPSNGKQHDDNYMEGYFSNFRAFGKLFLYSAKTTFMFFVTDQTSCYIKQGYSNKRKVHDSARDHNGNNFEVGRFSFLHESCICQPWLTFWVLLLHNFRISVVQIPSIFAGSVLWHFILSCGSQTSFA